MILRKAKSDEAKDVLIFYKNIIKAIENTDFKPKWNEKYPTLEYIKKCIKNSELYIYTTDSEIVSSFILNNKFDNDYFSVNWQIDAKPSEISIIHTFAINSKFQSKGLSREIFDKIKKISLDNNHKTIRIDIVGGNIGAQKVFEKLGFKYIATVKIAHYAVGLQDFHLYEYLLKK